MNRTRVLHFTSGQGESNYFRALAEYHDRDRYEMFFGTLAPWGPSHDSMTELGIAAFGLDATSRAEYGTAFLRLLRWLRQERISVAHAHLYDPVVVGLAAATVARVPVRALTAHHTNDSYLHLAARGKRAAFALDQFAVRALSNLVIAPSDGVLSVLRDRYRVRPGNLVKIPYGFDFSDWRARPDAARAIRAELGLGEGAVVCAIGRLNWIKDLPTLFRAFDLARRRAESLKLLIVGAGSEEPTLRRLAEELNAGGSIVFAGHRRDIPDILAAVDVLASSSLTEAFNQAIMEALASGVFVVATSVGAAPELLSSDRFGLLVEPGNVSALSAALLRGVELSKRHAEERRRLARTYPASDMVASYEQAYERWLRVRHR